jgi:serpin peptidase inhibitor clade A protein 3
MASAIKYAILSIAVLLQLYLAVANPQQKRDSTTVRTTNLNTRRASRNGSITSTTPVSPGNQSPGNNLLDNKLSFLTNQPFNEFDWKLSKLVDKAEKSNSILSPISVKLVLGMLYLGLQGHAAEEIEKALSFKSSARHEVIEKFSHILQSLERSKNNEYELNIGSKLFFDNSAVLQPQYSNDLSLHYNSTVEIVNFKNKEAAINIINTWCSAVTQGKIGNLLNTDDVSDSAIMILVNAIYFRGEWENQFPVESTVSDDFWITKNAPPVKVPVMGLKAQLYYYNMRELKAHLVRMPYVGHKFAMYLIVPYDIDGLYTLGAKIEPEYLAKALKNMTEAPINLRLPKFKFDSTTVLVPFLRQLGIQELFSANANLTNIGFASDGPLTVSSVIQKSGIEVNERGSVAHAATDAQIVSRFGEDPHDVNATHPFIFLIADEYKDTIVFLGKIVNPSSAPVEEPSAGGDISDLIRFGTNPEPVYSADNILHDRYNYFDKELLQKITKLTPTNVILSPASIKSALGLLYEGAEGKTKLELTRALRLFDDKQKTSTLLQMQQKALKSTSSVIALNSQNKIYVAQSESLLPSYQKRIRDLYYSDVESLNFGNSDTAVKIVNDWVNNVTEGLIPTLVTKDNFDSATKLFVINCIYFKAEWESEFDPKMTREECFYSSPGVCQKSFMMIDEKIAKYQHSKLLDGKIIELPFKDPRFTMVFMLPNKEDGVYDLVKNLQHQSMNSLLNNMRKVEVTVWIPRFTIEFSTSLAKALQEIDINDIFTTNANLSGILDQKKPVSLKDIIHKAKIEINEKGGKAAAATEGQVVLLSAPQVIEFKATHPFLFFIRDTEVAGFLFEGLVVSPEQVSSTLPNKVGNEPPRPAATTNRSPIRKTISPSTPNRGSYYPPTQQQNNYWNPNRVQY